ncbi:MAG: protein phosphatase 2C domain-containing protein [Gemmatimonadota bacterium]
MSLGLFQDFCPVSPQGGAEALGCLVASWETPILVVIGLGLVLAAFALVRRRERRTSPARYVLPAQAVDRPRRVAGKRPPSSSSGTRGEGWHPTGTTSGPSSTGSGPGALDRSRADDPNTTRGRPAPGFTPDGAAGEDWTGLATATRDDPGLDQAEGTLQLRPARLEIESGPGRGEQIRFVRLPGERQEITFGRADGHPHRHVRLDSPTVSRSHARLICRKGQWSLQNESSTNPTVHNGQSIESIVEEVPLADGDRIEMGEMVFLFRLPKSADRLALRSSWYTDRGRRSVNQDAVVVKTLPDGRELAAVCDGLGSHAAGGAASHIAIDALVAGLSTGTSLEDAVAEANDAVLRAAHESPDREGMGTTLVAMVRKGGRYEIANVGDSRAYRIGASGLRQVTRDHSFVSEAVRDGRMSMEEANRSPWRNAVTRNLGADEEVEVDIYGGYDGTDPFVLVLCTDGVHGVLDEEEILRVFRRTPDVRDLARALGEDALINGGEDNVAVAAVRFGPGANGASPGD